MMAWPPPRRCGPQSHRHGHSPLQRSGAALARVQPPSSVLPSSSRKHFSVGLDLRHSGTGCREESAVGCPSVTLTVLLLTVLLRGGVGSNMRFCFHRRKKRSSASIFPLRTGTCLFPLARLSVAHSAASYEVRDARLVLRSQKRGPSVFGVTAGLVQSQSRLCRPFALLRQMLINAPISPCSHSRAT